MVFGMKASTNRTILFEIQIRKIHSKFVVICQSNAWNSMAYQFSEWLGNLLPISNSGIH